MKAILLKRITFKSSYLFRLHKKGGLAPFRLRQIRRKASLLVFYGAKIQSVSANTVKIHGITRSCFKIMAIIP